MLIAAFLGRRGRQSHRDRRSWGCLVAFVGASIFAAIHGLASITFRGNQLISGVALNFLASGSPSSLGSTCSARAAALPPRARASASPRSTSRLRRAARHPVPRALPVRRRLGPDDHHLHRLPDGPVSWWVLYRTRFGLRLRAVGENPAAVDTAGISVTRLRFAAVGIAGLLCALAGAQLSIAGSASGFGREMTAGRGYIALAALIFAKWRPVAAMWACLLFGFLQALAIQPVIIERTWASASRPSSSTRCPTS
jgi:simple sugar transport system permease protein